MVQSVEKTLHKQIHSYTNQKIVKLKFSPLTPGRINALSTNEDLIMSGVNHRMSIINFEGQKWNMSWWVWDTPIIKPNSCLSTGVEPPSWGIVTCGNTTHQFHFMKSPHKALLWNLIHDLYHLQVVFFVPLPYQQNTSKEVRLLGGDIYTQITFKSFPHFLGGQKFQTKIVCWNFTNQLFFSLLKNETLRIFTTRVGPLRSLWIEWNSFDKWPKVHG